MYLSYIFPYWPGGQWPPGGLGHLWPLATGVPSAGLHPADTHHTHTKVQIYLGNRVDLHRYTTNTHCITDTTHHPGGYIYNTTCGVTSYTTGIAGMAETAHRAGLDSPPPPPLYPPYRRPGLLYGGYSVPPGI